MQIVGLLPTSLQDYPDEISAVLFTRGCNFHCPYCHNPELIGGKLGLSVRNEKEEKDMTVYDKSAVLNLLEERTDYLDGVVITGGEPTLQPDLADFLKLLTADFGYKTKLDTNGSQPQILRELLAADLVDMVGWDYKLPLNRYQELTPEENIAEKIVESGRILAETGVKVEVRTTVVPRLVNKRDIVKISRQIKDLGDNGFPDSFILQEFSSEQVLDCDFSTISPYRREKMKEFKEIAENYINNVKIRGDI